MKNVWIVAVIVGLVATAAQADDFASAVDYNWHQWRGPTANGMAPHGDPPVVWDEQTNIAWKICKCGG